MRILVLLLLFGFLPAASGNIRFEEVSQQAGITRIGESWGNAWGDFDGDGRLDLIVTGRVRPDPTGSLVTSDIFQQPPHGFANVRVNWSSNGPAALFKN